MISFIKKFLCCLLIYFIFVPIFFKTYFLTKRDKIRNWEKVLQKTVKIEDFGKNSWLFDVGITLQDIQKVSIFWGNFIKVDSLICT